MEILIIILLGLILLFLLATYFKGESPSNEKGYSEIKSALLKFDTSLEKSEKTINDQLQRNREESTKVSKENREELSNTLEKFEERFAKNIDAADKRQIFEFISPEQFIYAINYFKEKNITEFEAFEPLKELLMCEYYNTYVL